MSDDPAPRAGRGRLAWRLATRIHRNGPIPVADFMATALGDPEAGYYTGGDPLGATGDFVTAPEISQLFGEMVGLWLVDCWHRLGRPERVALIEPGPGRGTLMADALRAAAVAPGFLDAARLHLAETSPALRTRQAETLAALEGRLGRALAPRWHEGLDAALAAAPADMPLLLVANEFFDALPIHQFQRTQAGWAERLVGLDPESGALRFVLGPPSPGIEALLPRELPAARPGDIFEIGNTAAGLAGAVGARLAETGGAALIFDYGHGRPGFGETLQAVRGHRAVPVLERPGESDLTAHVDFAALAEAARRRGAAATAILTQGAFLQRLGIAARAWQLERANPGCCDEIRAGLARLVAGDQMGRLFKALALYSPDGPVPAGFEPTPFAAAET